MDSLTPLFRSSAWWIVSGLYRRSHGVAPEGDAWEAVKHMVTINKIARDFDAGLGNTFSDLLGVLILSLIHI